MKTAELIQLCDGVELPAPGRWPIGPGQKLLASKGVLGRREINLYTTGGVLEVAATRPIAWFDLMLASAGQQLLTVTYEGKLTGANRYGLWHLMGMITIGGSCPRPLELTVVYQGVYRYGAVPVVWLTITDAVVPAGSRSVKSWRRHRTVVEFHGDLNAHRLGL